MLPSNHLLLGCLQEEGEAYQVGDGVGVGSGHLLELSHQAAHFAP